MKCSKYNLFDKVGPLQYTKWKSFSGMVSAFRPPQTTLFHSLSLPRPSAAVIYCLMFESDGVELTVRSRTDGVITVPHNGLQDKRADILTSLHLCTLCEPQQWNGVRALK